MVCFLAYLPALELLALPLAPSTPQLTLCPPLGQLVCLSVPCPDHAPAS